jgi:hypothetical protein
VGRKVYIGCSTVLVVVVLFDEIIV